MILSYRHATALAVALLVNVDVGCGTALAAGQRSFVSTSGVDNPACSIAAPCRAFAAALTATSAGGEIIALDSGGYGPVTIAQSVSIIAAPGVYAGISVQSGHGVTIATAAADTVLLRGLTINNQGSTGRGIFISGAGIVRIENVQVSGFTGASALNATPSDVLQLHIRDSVFRKSNYGIALNYNNPAATMQISGTLVGVEISNNNGDGLGIGNNTVMTLSRSIVIKNNGVGVGFVPAMGQTNHLNVDNCEISENTQGLYPGDTPGSTVLQVSRSRIIGNGTGFAIGSNSITRISDNVIENNGYGITLGTGTIETSGNNVVRGNANAEVLPPATPLK
jgi:hypothetical protein